MSELILKEDALNCFHDWIDRYGYEHTADEDQVYQRIEALDTVRCCDEDCISRRVVKKKLEQNLAYMRVFGVDRCLGLIDEIPAVQPERVCVATATLTDEQVKEAVEKAKNAVISVIEPEPHWIPCSERLPKKTGYYLTTNEYKVVHEDYYWGSGCFEKAKKYQCEVVAWMPMPIPPYCGGGNG